MTHVLFGEQEIMEIQWGQPTFFHDNSALLGYWSTCRYDRRSKGTTTNVVVIDEAVHIFAPWGCAASLPITLSFFAPNVRSCYLNTYTK